MTLLTQIEAATSLGLGRSEDTGGPRCLSGPLQAAGILMASPPQNRRSLEAGTAKDSSGGQWKDHSSQ